MSINLPEKEKISKKRVVIYTISAIICIFAVIIAVGVEVLGDDFIDGLFGINKIVKRTEQEEAALKANFENLFDNMGKNIENFNIQRIDNNQELLYTSYQKQEKTDNYEIDINIPYINIDNSDVKNFNKNITDTYVVKAEKIMEKETENVIYTIKYKANIENNILSVIIYCDLKEGTDPQRITIDTFNYSLDKQEQIDFKQVLDIYDLSKNEVQNKIGNDIEEEQKKSEDLKKLGYNVFTRDINSKIYEVENIKEFFIYNNNIFIIFAYGNNSVTSEMDLVII